ncbi:metallophosphoesterase [Sporosarcina sp.]|uniref:metallophosphoesterase n=1 Tax=Sporosarcina sp. TaxID=49982 RepID=UPI00261C1B8E|nr:metallophosphoesterase [Sporosarcina sp.]
MIKRRILYTAAVLAIVGYFIWFQNNSITVTQSEISSSTIPESFDQYKIVHLSDLHNKSFGKNQRRLFRKINKLQPDVIVYTGDLIDSNRAGDEAGLILMEELTAVAPVYYVSGNHEWWSGTFSSLESSLEDIGVQVLRNEHAVLKKGNDKMYLVGIDDPAHDGSRAERETAEEDIVQSIEGLEKDSFTILLTHRPELLSLYAEYNFGIVFAGHAHGGQVRIPFIGGLVAPNQGFLPAYTAGKHDLNHTVMMVSRGLGNSIIPLRLFNRPEIVAVTLKAD